MPSAPRYYHLDASKSIKSEGWARHSLTSLPDLISLWFLKLSCAPGNMDNGKENNPGFTWLFLPSIFWSRHWKGWGKVTQAGKSWGEGGPYERKHLKSEWPELRTLHPLRPWNHFRELPRALPMSSNKPMRLFHFVFSWAIAPAIYPHAVPTGYSCSGTATHLLLWLQGGDAAHCSAAGSQASYQPFPWAETASLR